MARLNQSESGWYKFVTSSGEEIGEAKYFGDNTNMRAFLRLSPFNPNNVEVITLHPRSVRMIEGNVFTLSAPPIVAVTYRADNPEHEPVYKASLLLIQEGER